MRQVAGWGCAGCDVMGLTLVSQRETNRGPHQGGYIEIISNVCIFSVCFTLTGDSVGTMLDRHFLHVIIGSFQIFWLPVNLDIYFRQTNYFILALLWRLIHTVQYLMPHASLQTLQTFCPSNSENKQTPTYIPLIKIMMPPVFTCSLSALSAADKAIELQGSKRFLFVLITEPCL